MSFFFLLTAYIFYHQKSNKFLICYNTSCILIPCVLHRIASVYCMYIEYVSFHRDRCLLQEDIQVGKKWPSAASQCQCLLAYPMTAWMLSQEIGRQYSVQVKERDTQSLCPTRAFCVTLCKGTLTSVNI